MPNGPQLVQGAPFAALLVSLFGARIPAHGIQGAQHSPPRRKDFLRTEWWFSPLFVTLRPRRKEFLRTDWLPCLLTGARFRRTDVPDGIACDSCSHYEVACMTGIAFPMTD